MLIEYRKIICSHSLLVLVQERVTKASEKYVLTKWSKTVRRKHTYIRAFYGGKQRATY